MAYLLKYLDGSAQVLNGRVAITRQDNDITKPDTVQAAFSTSFDLPDDVATHKRLTQPHVGMSLSSVPYMGAEVYLEASGVEVLPGARLRFSNYTPRTGYTGQLLAGNKSFYDLLGDKTLRDLDMSAYDHEWTLANVAAGAAHRDYRKGYVYDLYDRGLGAPPLPPVSSKLYEAGYWPTAYARAVWEQIFEDAGVGWLGTLPPSFDTTLLPATQPYGYSDATRQAHEYSPADQRRRFTSEQDAVLPYRQTGAAKQDADLHVGSAAQVDTMLFTRTITLAGYYDLKAEQDVHIYCNNIFPGEVSATGPSLGQREAGGQ